MSIYKTYQLYDPCTVCGVEGDGLVTGHHIYTRKAFPEYANAKWNLCPLCQKHHNEAHAYGNITMMDIYPRFSEWLELNGWQLFNGKLIHKD